MLPPSERLWPEEAAAHRAREEPADSSTSCQVTQPPQLASSFAKGLAGQQCLLFKAAGYREPQEWPGRCEPSVPQGTQS